MPTVGDKITVHYVGTLESGEEFDSSRSRGKAFEFKLGVAEVIKGWDMGVATMRKGERALFTIAADLAYGERGAPPKIPANATLQFDVELIDFESVGDADDDLDDLDDFGDIEGDLDGPDDFEDDYGRKDLGPGGEDPGGRYRWERKGAEIVVVAPLKEDMGARDVKADFRLRQVSVAIQGEVLFEGTPGCELEDEECWWEIDEDAGGERCLFVHLQKKNADYSKWPPTLLKAQDS